MRHLEKLQPEALSVGLSVEEPVRILLDTTASCK